MALVERIRFPEHGFSLARSKYFTYSELPVKPGGPVVHIASGDGKAECHVLLGPLVSTQEQEAGTLETGQELGALLAQGLVGKVLPIDRPDRRVCYRVSLTSRARDGMVVSVAGEACTFLLLGTFPARRDTPVVRDLLEVLVGLRVLR